MQIYFLKYVFKIFCDVALAGSEQHYTILIIWENKFTTSWNTGSWAGFCLYIHVWIFTPDERPRSPFWCNRGDLTRGAYKCCLAFKHQRRVTSRHSLLVAMVLWQKVLLHGKAMPQTQDITPTPSQYSDTGPTCRRAIHWCGTSHWNT